MQYEYLPNYFDNFEEVLDYNKYQEITAISRRMRPRLIEHYSPLLNSKYRELSSSDQRKAMAKILEEIKDYFSKMGGRGKPQTPSGLYENILNGFINGFSRMQYQGRKLNASDIIRGDFDKSEIKLVDGGFTQKGKKAIDIDDKKAKWQNILKKPEFTADNEANKTIKRNIRRLFARIQDEYKAGSKGKIRGEIAAKMSIGFDVSSVFNAKSMKNFENRERAYDYWKKVSLESFKDLNVQLNNLKAHFEKIPEKDKTMLALDKLISNEENIKNLNYIEKFDRTQVAVKDIDVVAYETFENFLNYIGGIMEVQDKDLYQNIEYSRYFGESGNLEQSSDIDEKVEIDSLPVQIEEFKDILEEDQPLDPLGLIYFRKELKEIGLVNTNLQTLKEELKEYFDDLSPDNPNYPNLEEDDVKGLFEYFLDGLESVEDIGDELYLPIFMANDPALKNEYRSLAGEASKADDTIKQFLKAFKEFLEQDKATLSSNVRLDMAGAGTTPVSKKPEDRMRNPKTGFPFIWFSYSNYAAGSTGSQRYDSDKTTMKEAKDLHEEISVTVNKISKLIADCFLAPQFSPYRAGIRLPFEGDFTLRLIAATRPIGSKYKAIKAVNKVLLERDTAFLEEEDIDDITTYLKTLAGSNNITDYSKLYAASTDLLTTLKGVFDDDSVSKDLVSDIGSILGSVYRLIPEEDRTKIERDGEHKFPKRKTSVLDLYDKRNADEPLDIYPMQVLVDVIRTRGENLLYRTEKGDKETFSNEKAKELLGLLDRVAKSIVQRKLLEAHDMLRILKSKEVIHSMKNENNYDDMENMITKMETQFNIDMSANEIIGVVKAVDSFEGIAKEYGIDAEHVYVLKANFR